MANERLKTDYSVTHIRYVENDSQPEAAYGLFAAEIIERLCRGDFGEEGSDLREV